MTRSADNALVRAVGRVPVTVRTKLLAAFALMVVLLVVVAALGLRVLGQSNSRIESLGTLQLRAATYQSLQSQALLLRQLLAVRVAADPNLNSYLGGSDSGILGGHSWTLVDQSIAAALSQLGPATAAAGLGFSPPPPDSPVLDPIRFDYPHFTQALNRIIALDRADAPSTTSKPFLARTIDADNDLGARTDQLAT